MQTTMTTPKHQNHSILNGFPPIQCQHEVSSQSGFLRDQVRCKWQNTCDTSTCGSELVTMSIVQDWISGLWLNWCLLVFLYKDQLIHMMTRITMKIQKHLLSCYIQIKWALLHFLKDHWNANLRVFILITVFLITVIQARFCPVIRFSFLSSLRGAYTVGRWPSEEGLLLGSSCGGSSVTLFHLCLVLLNGYRPFNPCFLVLSPKVLLVHT